MSETRFFCFSCWGEVNSQDTICPWCGNDLTAADDMSYDEKLIKALNHFEPETAIRAAQILAMKKVREGADAIADAFANRADLDPIMAHAFLKAIAEIEGKSETSVAMDLKKRDGFKSETATNIIDALIVSRQTLI